MSTFYWDFLMRHEAELVTNQRAALMMRNLARYRPAEREAMRAQAQAMLEKIEQL